MDAEAFFSSAKVDVEAKLWKVIKEQMVYKQLKYALSGGKRLRSCLTMLVFNACRGKLSEKALEAAVAIEFAHSASLVHDDILDGDLQRRGKPTAHLKYGVKDAVMLGHKMVNLGLKIVINHDLDVVKTFIDTWGSTLEGEMMDIELSKREIKDLIPNCRELYFDVISKKTASLFAGSCLIGAKEAKASEDLQNLFWKYGNLVGMAHQLADDYVDMKKDKLEVLPLVFLISTDPLVNRVKMDLNCAINKKSLRKLGVNGESAFKFEIKKMVEEAESLAEDERIPNSSYKKALVETPRYVVKRMLMEAGEQWNF